MSLSFARSRVGLTLVPFCLASLCLWASVVAQQEAGGNSEMQPGTQTPPVTSPDFEMKIERGQILVRQKGSQEWKRSTELNEPVAVGLLDGSHKIYVVTKAIKPPRAKHSGVPEYPPDERGSGKEGRVSMHIVVDEQGAVRLPTVDASSGPKFAKAAIKAVKKWTFEPAKLNGQPVAALTIVEFDSYVY
jgi:TonB family protein